MAPDESWAILHLNRLNSHWSRKEERFSPFAWVRVLLCEYDEALLKVFVNVSSTVFIDSYLTLSLCTVEYCPTSPSFLKLGFVCQVIYSSFFLSLNHTFSISITDFLFSSHAKMWIQLKVLSLGFSACCLLYFSFQRPFTPCLKLSITFVWMTPRSLSPDLTTLLISSPIFHVANCISLTTCIFERIMLSIASPSNLSFSFGVPYFFLQPSDF